MSIFFWHSTHAPCTHAHLQLTVFNAVEQPGAHWLGFQIDFVYDVCFFLCTRRMDPDRNFGILPWFYIMPWIKAMLHAAAERLRYGATISDLIGCSCSYISWLIWMGEKFQTLYSSVYSTKLPVIFFLHWITRQYALQLRLWLAENKMSCITANLVLQIGYWP